jgi:methylenetetrahydrofolate dehydrogenase (NADP+) / methenyltetrahydrofolate cyclohydrolase
MAAEIIDGRAVADAMRAEVRARSEALRRRGVSPRLLVSLVGEDEANLAYARSLQRAGERVAVDVEVDVLPATTTEETLRARLAERGSDARVHGIVLAQPLRPPLAIARVADAIPPAKDVDATNPKSHFVPATPGAILRLLEESAAAPLAGKRALVIGRSRVVGLPAALLLLGRSATVTIAHSKTRDLPRHIRDAEIVVTATGVPGLVRGEMLAPGSVVIDAGTNLVDGKIVGDVDFTSASKIAAAITPVPGGVGPVTNVVLMNNVVTAAEAL